MSENKQVYYSEEDEEFSFRKSLRDRKKDFLFLWKQKAKIILICILGGILGALIAWKWPVTYTARLTFVVEEGKSGGGGLISSLAGQLGFDLGGLAGSTGGGVLAGDNVMQLLISQKMLKQTMLTPYDSASNKTLADRYTEVNKLNKKWAKLNKDKPVAFPVNTAGYTRLQDSLLHAILKTVSEKEVSVSKPDKKLSFFALNATMKDERLASMFCARLIDQASEFYIQTKTKRLRTNVDRLQHRADSIGVLLNKKTYSSASANSILLDVNPAYPTASVSSEVQERDKRVLQTIYSEIIKNLEVSRTMLMQETPTFQIVDEPDLPLKKNKLKFLSSIVLGMFLSGLCFGTFLLVRRK